MNEPQELVVHDATATKEGAIAYRASTNAASLCAEIVKKTAKRIQNKNYVCIEGFQAIAIAHGCTASARNVEKVEGGWRAIGEVRRMSDGQLIATAEGFLGEDEPTWANRPLFARRAMVQTRAMSRACRSAFAHVVVMIDADLGTTPAEEMEAIEAPREKVATVTGEVKKKKPEWSADQKEEAGRLRKDIIDKLGDDGDKRVKDLWHKMAYDNPSDTLDALSALAREVGA